ncbi:MAG TPA: hypothetical protein VFI27_03965 [candidate division Zixibacteria bacterium]|nr:hypothetical protein [candidate division Zixibacteria bacterium]
MSKNGKESLEKRAQKAMLQHAFFRWESAVVIALTLLLTVFGSSIAGFVPNWVWFLSGILAEAAVVYSSYTDPETGRKVVSEMLHNEFRPERLNDENLQQKMEEAFDYRGRITTAIRDRRDSVLKDNLSETARQIDDWLENIYDLALRLDRYRSEKDILLRDKHRAQASITELEARLEGDSDPAVRKQIEETIKVKRRQLETIDSYDQTMERAQLQLDTTLSSLGTIYSQTMLVGAKDIDSGRAKRLRQDIAEEVQELDNILITMEEVYASGSEG